MTPLEALRGVFTSPALTAAAWGMAASFALCVLLVITNLFSVAKYGEFEFWFAMAKVIAIVGFIGLGFSVLMGWIPDREASGLSRLMEEHGGFAPNGLSAVVGAFIATPSGSFSTVLPISSGALRLGGALQPPLVLQ